MNRLPVTFESHQPERRRRAATTVYANGCTTCCCCCLHAVGSLIGAAVAPAIGSGRPPSLFHYDDTEAGFAPTRPPATGVKTVESAIQAGPRHPLLFPEDDEDRRSGSRPSGFGVSAVALFWWLVLGLSIFGLFLFGLQGGSESLVAGLVILALTLPAVQLGSAILVLFVLLASRRIDRPYQMKQLGKLTLGTVLGTVAGILLMILIAAVMSGK